MIKILQDGCDGTSNRSDAPRGHERVGELCVRKTELLPHGFNIGGISK